MAKSNFPDLFRFEREMAVAIMEQQNVTALLALKRFLLNMATSKAIETVLAQAVCYCAEELPETFDWILCQREHLEPELLLEQWARSLVTQRFLHQGCEAGREFDFESQAQSGQLQLHLCQRAMQILRESSSKGEWLLLNRLFKIKT